MEGHVLDSVPYPWPYDGAVGLAPERVAVVVGGLQHRWATRELEPVIQRIRALMSGLREVGVLVVFVRHARPPRPIRPRHDLPLARTAAWELVGVPHPRDVVVDAGGCDGFHASVLDGELRAHRRDHLLLAGLAGEMLVDTTLRSANDRGYECLTVRDAVAPLSPDTGERVLASVTMSGGIFGALGSSDAVLAAFGARTPRACGEPAEEVLT